MDERSQQSRRTDLIVIGGGVVGAAAALAAARGGARTVLLEAGPLAAARGSSAGSARIFVPAAYPDRSYLERGLRALELWRAIEAESGERLLWRTGALSRGEFAERELAELREAGVEAEALTAAEARRRFGVRFADSEPVVHQPDAGVIRADRARAALLRLAQAAGAELCEGERVRSIAAGEDSVELVGDRRRWRCSAAIVAAGPWSPELLGELGLGPPLTVTAQSVAYFALRDPNARPPAVVEYDGLEPYACWDPKRGLKAALHAPGPAAGPGERPPPHTDAVDRVATWVEATFPDAVATPTAVESCLYTNTADERFRIERSGRIVIACACNGQGFQLAPETAERLAQLATEAGALAATGA